MRDAAAAAVVIAVIAAPGIAAAAAPAGSPIVPSFGAVAHARPNITRARPVQLTLTLHQELQCGRLRGRSVLVVLPRAFAVPRRIVPAAVQVGGETPLAVLVSRRARSVRITLPPPPGLICDSIGPGSISVVFEKAAHLGNPAKPGHYRVSITVGPEHLVARIRIR